MTTIATTITHQIPVEFRWLERIRCNVGVHDWSKWEVAEATLNKQAVLRQVRECICCGLKQTRAL